MLHLFDHTVKPVLIYGSEIWGTINTTTSKVQKDYFNLFNTLSDLPCEILHIRFLKYVLGVYRKATNAAVFGELGWFPIEIEVLCNTIKYFQRLHSEPTNLLAGALKESCCLYGNMKKSWMSSIYFVFKYRKVQPKNYFGNDVNFVRSKLIEKYKTSWADSLSENRNGHIGKLRTYPLFKHRLCREPYT